MELEELKHIWKAHTSEAIEQREVDAQSLRLMIRQRSQKALRLINRAIWVELILILLLGFSGWVWFSISQNALFTWELIPLWIFMFISVLFYVFKYRLLNRNPLGDLNLKESLTILSQNLGKFMRLYYVMALFVLPLIGSLFFILGMNLGLQVQGGEFKSITFSQWGIIGVALSIYIIFIVVVTRWYVNKIYGRHYHTLKLCLSELE